MTHEEQQKHMEQFDVYFNEVIEIVSTLERLHEKNSRTRKTKHGALAQESAEDFFDVDALVDAIDPPEKESSKSKKQGKMKKVDEAETLYRTLQKKVKALSKYKKHNFNLERLITTFNLSLQERLILYIVTVYSLYADSLTTISVRKVLELISLQGEIYITNYHFISGSGALITQGLLTLSKEMFAGDTGSDFIYTNIGFSNNKLLFAFLEQASWSHLESVIEKNTYAQIDSSYLSSAQFEQIIDTITPKDIVRELDKHVIGQRKAKKVLAVQSYLHYLRVRNSDFVPFRSNIMMIGSTGVGKTYLAKKLADILSLPFVRSDVTTLTETGYVGDDVEVVLFDLYKKANNDLSLAEKGIVFLDEVDKIAKADTHQSTTGNPSDKAVQEALLSMLNGEEIRVPEAGDRRMLHTSEGIMMSTKNILFVFGGAFVGLEDIISNRLKGDHTLGFNTPLYNTEEERERVITKVDVKDLEKYGMIPEFLGRIPITVVLNKLRKEDMHRILTKSSDSALLKYYDFFKSMNKRLIVNNEAIDLIVDRAHAMDMGARALKSVVENVMVGILYDHDYANEHSLRITKKLVERAFNETEDDEVDESADHLFDDDEAGQEKPSKPLMA